MTLDFDWAHKLWITYPELFDIHAHLEAQTNRDTVVRSGQLWFALPEGAFVRLCDRPRRPTKHCPGYLKAGTWTPLRDEPLGPMAMKLIVNERPGQAPSIDPWHKRPGIVLGDPHAAVAVTEPRTSQPSLLQYGRALWIKGQSDPIQKHGQLNVKTPTGALAYYHLWAAWGVSSSPGQELLCLTPDKDLSRCHSVYGARPVLPEATGLLAEVLGVHPWRGSTLTAKTSAWPERGDVVLVRLGSREARVTPCLVVSPGVLNRQNDLVVLQCVPYRSHHETAATMVPIGPSFVEEGIRWTVDLALVRGIGRAGRYWRFCSPAHSLDTAELLEIDARLRDLYA